MTSGGANRNVMAAKAGDGNYYFAHSYGSNNQQKNGGTQSG